MPIILSKFNFEVKYKDKYLLYNSLHDVCYVLSEPLSQIDVKTLLQYRLAVDENVDEDSMAYSKMVNLLCDKSKLSLTVLPTFACNFRCTYCYEDHSAKHMSPEVEQALIRYLRKNSAGKNLFIGWFGGEPLLCKQIVYRINEEAKKLANYYHRSFSSSMTTNGYLLDLETFSRLLKLNVRSYQITIDGSETSHNCTRPCADNGPSYRTIIENLKAIRDNIKSRNFEILIRVNLLTETLLNLDSEVAELQREFGRDSRFKFFFKQVGDYGGDRVHDLDCSMLNEIDAIDKALLSSKEKYNIIPTSNVLNANPCCYAAESHSFVVLPDGGVSKCTVHFNNPSNQIGYITSDGKMELNDRATQWDLLGRYSFNATSCGNCPLMANCFGIGCPSQRVVKGIYRESKDHIECLLRKQMESAITSLYHMRPDLFNKL